MKDHASNYVNCNCRRCLLGLNPLPDPSETLKKPSRNTGKKASVKPKPTALKELTPTNQVVGLDGNQLLEAINKESDDTPMKLCISSVLHEKAQEQLNQSSQRLLSQSMTQTWFSKHYVCDHMITYYVYSLEYWGN